jgi:hypothetical protein
MDTNNPVVKLCADGMKAEMEGKPEEARQLFMQAWEQSKDDYDACIVAHYCARHQRSPQEILRWNQESLDRANAVNDERVRGFYPSLYLNIGKAHEDLAKSGRGQEILRVSRQTIKRSSRRKIRRHGSGRSQAGVAAGRLISPRLAA